MQPTTLYEFRIEIQALDDGGDYRYMATSPDLSGLIVAGDTPDEVLSLVPPVAAALIASMKADGQPLPAAVRGSADLPFAARVTVAA
jgi:predicted RNase H-like HicB family nuclease